MRFRAVATLTTFAATGLILIWQPGCNLIETRQDAGSGGSGGGSSVKSSGGAGGAKSSGGTTSSGGAADSGGSGGSDPTSSGGSGGIASGGSGGSGGTSSPTTATGRGGAGSDAGGAPSGGSGGKAGAGGNAGAGGTTASGGSTTTSVGNCTDDPPPDQTPTCSQWSSYNVCSQSWFATYCNRSCGRCSGGSQGGAGGSGGSSAKGGSGGAGGSGGSSSGGVSGSGGTTAKGGSGGGGGVSGPGSTNPQISGTNGWASRYWDCCKPSCGWSANSNPPVPACQKDGATRVSADAKNGCEGGGSAYECYDFSPWYDASTNLSYGFVAYNGVACGTCFELQFNGNGNSGANAGAAALKGQQMIVQVINIGGLQANQFDILVPGGGVGAMTQGCTAQWGNVDLGATYGGLLSECNGDCNCMKGKCSSVFGNMSAAIRNGCDWFTGWYSCADNPQLVYKQVSCPSQLSNKTGVSR